MARVSKFPAVHDFDALKYEKNVDFRMFESANKWGPN